MLKRVVFIVFTGVLGYVQTPLFSSEASAHSGGTDSNGCHTCRTNCPSYNLNFGEYHCHNPKGSNGYATLPPLTYSTYPPLTYSTYPPLTYSTYPPLTYSTSPPLTYFAPTPTRSTPSQSQSSEDYSGLASLGFFGLIVGGLWFFGRNKN